MSIDATISDVLYNDDGTATLDLVPRDSRYASAGQSQLVVENPPPRNALDVVIGCNIWGNASVIMIGSKKWAERIGYTAIRLMEDAT